MINKRGYRCILEAKDHPSLDKIFSRRNTMPNDLILSVPTLETFLRSGVWYNTISETDNILNLMENVTELMGSNPNRKNHIATTVTKFFTENPIVTDWNRIHDSLNEDFKIDDELLNFINEMDDLANDVFAYEVANQMLGFTEAINVVKSSNSNAMSQYYELLKQYMTLEVPDEKKHFYFRKLLEVEFRNSPSIPRFAIDASNLFFYMNGLLDKEYCYLTIKHTSLFIDTELNKSIFDLEPEIGCLKFFALMYEDHYDEDFDFKNAFKIIFNNIKSFNIKDSFRIVKYYFVPNIIDDDVDEIVSKLYTYLEGRVKETTVNYYETIFNRLMTRLNSKNSDNEALKLVTGQTNVQYLHSILYEIENNKFNSVKMSKLLDKYSKIPSNDNDIILNTTEVGIITLWILKYKISPFGILCILEPLIHSLQYVDECQAYYLIRIVNEINKYKVEYNSENNILLNSYIDKINTSLCRIIKEFEWTASSSELPVDGTEDVLMLDSLVNNLTSDTKTFIIDLIDIIESLDIGPKANSMLYNNIKITMVGKNMNSMDNVLKHITFINAVISYIIKINKLNRYAYAVNRLIKDIPLILEPCVQNIAGHDMEEIVEDLLKFKIYINNSTDSYRYDEIVESIEFVINCLKRHYKLKYYTGMSIFKITNKVFYNEILRYLSRCDYNINTIKNVTKNYPFINKDILDNIMDYFAEFDDEESLDSLLNSGFDVCFERSADLLTLLTALVINPSMKVHNKTKKLTYIFRAYLKLINDNMERFEVCQDSLYKLKYSYIGLIHILPDVRDKVIMIPEFQEFLDKAVNILDSHSDIIQVLESYITEDEEKEDEYETDLKIDDKKEDSKGDEDDDGEDDNDGSVSDNNDDDGNDADSSSDDDDDDWEVYNENPKVHESYLNEEILKACFYSDVLLYEQYCLENGLIRYFSLTPTQKLKYGFTTNISENVYPDTELRKMIYAISENMDRISQDDIKNIIEESNQMISEASSKEEKKKKAAKKVKVAKSKTVKAIKQGKSGLDKARSEVKTITADLGIIKNKVKDAAAGLARTNTQVSNKIDTMFDSTIASIEKSSHKKNREAVLKGKLFPSLSYLIKLVGVSGVTTAIGQPIIGLVILIGGIGSSVHATKRERNAVLDELEVQLKVIDKQIADIESGGDTDYSAYEVLLKIKKRLQKERAKVMYKTPNARNAAMRNSLKRKED